MDSTMHYAQCYSVCDQETRRPKLFNGVQFSIISKYNDYTHFRNEDKKIKL